MVYNFLIVLFKNKDKRKIINKFQTFKKTEKFFNELLEKSNSIIFEKKFDNGHESDYELAILQKKSEVKNFMYIKDDFGRTIKVDLEDDDYQILKISNFKVEETILDYQTKKKITVPFLLKTYLSKEGLKMISKLNNKIVIQNDDVFNMFTLKNDEDANRFIESLSTHFINIGRNDCIFVKDSSTVQRKYLYTLLVEKGFPKSYLFRHSTTHPTKK